MRGKAKRIDGAVTLIRITPAYAGKSMVSKCRLSTEKDHPRLCGEKSSNSFEHSLILGSPPPMRGKAAILEEALLSHRITPAYAGKSLRKTPL